MIKKRNRYSPQEKARIALEAIRGELTLAQISSKYQVHATQINQWKKLALAHLPEAFSNTSNQVQTTHETELSALYEQIGRLKVENEFLKKSKRFSSEEKIAMLEPAHPTLSLRRQCTLLDANRSSYYYVPESHELTEQQLSLLRTVDEVYTNYPFFGTRQMADYVSLHHEPWVKRHHTRWAYKRLGLQSVAPGPHTSQPHPEHKVYPYLLRHYSITRPNEVWSTDLTYIRLRHGFVYLMAIIDWYSRFVLDWELSISMEAEGCIETLRRVLQSSRCNIFNTDQGSQFTATGFTGLLEAHQIAISMDGKGRALDNVFVERLWRSVKYECVYLHDWQTPTEARAGLRNYFDFYNYQRPHQSLGGKTPYAVHHNEVH